jgi:hypothetical protein
MSMIGNDDDVRISFSLQKFVLICLTLIVAASCQIYTKIGEDGYSYPKPQARFNLPEPIQAEPAVRNLFMFK